MKKVTLVVAMLVLSCGSAYAADDLLNCKWENGEAMSDETCNDQRKIASPYQRMRFKDEIEKFERNKLVQKLAACAEKSYRDLSDAEKAAISKVVSDRLKDPESARFKWMKMVVGSINYCGLVNAKNSYGGYTGYTPFDASFATGKDGTVYMLNTSISDKDDLNSFTQKCAEECYINLGDAM